MMRHVLYCMIHDSFHVSHKIVVHVLGFSAVYRYQVPGVSCIVGCRGADKLSVER